MSSVGSARATVLALALASRHDDRPQAPSSPGSMGLGPRTARVTRPSSAPGRASRSRSRSTCSPGPYHHGQSPADADDVVHHQGHEAGRRASRAFAPMRDRRRRRTGKGAHRNVLGRIARALSERAGLDRQQLQALHPVGPLAAAAGELTCAAPSSLPPRSCSRRPPDFRRSSCAPRRRGRGRAIPVGQ